MLCLILVNPAMDLGCSWSKEPLLFFTKTEVAFSLVGRTKTESMQKLSKFKRRTLIKEIRTKVRLNAKRLMIGIKSKTGNYQLNNASVLTIGWLESDTRRQKKRD